MYSENEAKNLLFSYEKKTFCMGTQEIKKTDSPVHSLFLPISELAPGSCVSLLEHRSGGQMQSSHFSLSATQWHLLLLQ